MTAIKNIFGLDALDAFDILLDAARCCGLNIPDLPGYLDISPMLGLLGARPTSAPLTADCRRHRSSMRRMASLCLTLILQLLL